MTFRHPAVLALILLGFALGGCGAVPTPSGYLTSYSSLGEPNGFQQTFAASPLTEETPSVYVEDVAIAYHSDAFALGRIEKGSFAEDDAVAIDLPYPDRAVVRRR